VVAGSLKRIPIVVMDINAEDNTERVLCRLDDIPEGGAKGLLREFNDDRLFVVRRRGEVFAYLNTCPHNWRPLEYRQDQFLSPLGQHIVCYAHGAHFRIEDGFCFLGPCSGQRLIGIPVRVEDGCVILGGTLPKPPRIR
jgi:nitrite reductase/ring-hydroxylating ferredoxin subunit